MTVKSSKLIHMRRGFCATVTTTRVLSSPRAHVQSSSRARTIVGAQVQHRHLHLSPREADHLQLSQVLLVQHMSFAVCYVQLYLFECKVDWFHLAHRNCFMPFFNLAGRISCAKAVGKRSTIEPTRGNFPMTIIAHHSTINHHSFAITASFCH